MATILDLVTPKSIAANWTEVESNRVPFLGEALFPARKKAGLDLAWLKGNRGLPVSLMPTAFDAKATFRDRPGVTKTETEMPFFREGFKIKEKDRQDMLRVRDANDPYMDEILSHIYDDSAELIEGANVVPERMIMSLLFANTGNAQITFNANGVSYAYNYDSGSAWKTANYAALTTTALWSATATADPIADMQAVQNAARAATGTEIRRAIMNSTTFNAMAATAALKNRFITANGLAVGYLTNREVAQLIEATLGITVIVYDKQYKDESGTAHKFVPDGYVCFVPEGPLGNTWYGTTPEEADLMGSGIAQVSVVHTGVAISREVQQHPVNVNIFASEIVLPSFERMDEVYLRKVLA